MRGDVYSGHRIGRKVSGSFHLFLPPPRARWGCGRLNCFHAFELVGDYEGGFAFVKKFLKEQGGKSKLAGQVYDLIKGQASVYGKEEAGASALSSARVVYVKGEPVTVRGHVVVDGQDLGDLPRAGVTPGREKYTPETLDLMAIFFTLVKVLYHCGNISVLPDIVKVVEPARLRSLEEVHTTTVHNENAYFMCISQLLAVRPGPAVNPRALLGADDAPTKKPVYVCGDLHALSPAWKEVGGRLLVPKLVTGLKHWHLREESVFYPKKSFHRTVAEIPKGADVLFIFGEIDCREGLLVAVEKDRYEDLEEGMKTCVDIWMKEAGKVVEERGFRAMIHPVIPVLKETRKIVMNYNRIFKRAVAEHPSMVWLDIFDDFVELRGGEWELREEVRVRERGARGEETMLLANVTERDELQILQTGRMR